MQTLFCKLQNQKPKNPENLHRISGSDNKVWPIADSLPS